MSKLKTFLFGASIGAVAALLTTKYDGVTMQKKLKKYSREKLNRLNILAEDVAIEASLQKENLTTHYKESKENLSQVLSDTKELLSSKEDMKQAFINLKEAVSKSSISSTAQLGQGFKEEVQPHVDNLKENIENVKSETKDLKENLKNNK